MNPIDLVKYNVSSKHSGITFWVITDTHLGHDKLVEKGFRESGFEQHIFSHMYNLVKPQDIVIHLGDVCMGKDAYWHEQFLALPGKKWLVLGNHDNKSMSWYLKKGWDSVSQSVFLLLYGKLIAFSHIPLDLRKYTEVDINIHGHFHNPERCDRRMECDHFYSDKHRLVHIEDDYKPKELRKFLGV